jgi:hypothetical protein
MSYKDFTFDDDDDDDDNNHNHDGGQLGTAWDTWGRLWTIGDNLGQLGTAGDSWNLTLPVCEQKLKEL